MGLRNTVEVVTGLLLRQAFPAGDNTALESFWQTSSGIAETTAQLARPLGITNRDEAYTFALFRDCGVPLMIGKFPLYAKFINQNRQTGTATAPEVVQFGIDHASLGARLAQSWMLPQGNLHRHFQSSRLCVAARRLDPQGKLHTGGTSTGGGADFHPPASRPRVRGMVNGRRIRPAVPEHHRRAFACSCGEVGSLKLRRSRRSFFGAWIAEHRPQLASPPRAAAGLFAWRCNVPHGSLPRRLRGWKTR